MSSTLPLPIASASQPPLHRATPVAEAAALSCEQLQQVAAAARPGALRPLLIDTRSGRQFRRGHLRGSHHIPAARLLSSELPEGDLILISEGSDQARQLIEALHSGGYHRRIRYLGEGFPGWRRCQLPVELPQAALHPPSPARRRRSSAALLSLAGLLLLLAGGLGQALPLLALGLLLLAGPWIEASLLERHPLRRLELDG